ncbi:hypothetical protein [Helicobacter pylori]|jgi:Telomere-length maintenance and DNA damage repair.|uniref:Uncharacterized protein n=2 Tax=Helicobacter pylori TaxID=210 RepID=O25866_HELPY|nr:hypothetical protein [Helicobacter pylori]AAD08328.1 predicted coding region HP1276 [Helicobacter pylori 26695]AFV42494.1 hypothetical protein C694_06595 [Helicobacter pylori 26695]AFV44089.1 hypothetical protein C695_06605 [Helicobacter pylori Rif1]AFV45682.1 hypothetical protein C730_06605 [Helicobacter pylori Rif2]AJF09497.1 hypothetical protein SE87_06585 [Helicobacter pylori 26695-1]
MDKKDKNKNASHLTHEMKKEHGGLLEASKKAEMQPIFKALWGIAQEEKEGYKQAAEGYKKALEAKEKMDKIVNTLKAINHDNNTIDIEPEDEKD